MKKDIVIPERIVKFEKADHANIHKELKEYCSLIRERENYRGYEPLNDCRCSFIEMLERG